MLTLAKKKPQNNSVLEIDVKPVFKMTLHALSPTEGQSAL